MRESPAGRMQVNCAYPGRCTSRQFRRTPMLYDSRLNPEGTGNLIEKRGARFMEPEWWLWAVGGIALIIAELIVPAFVLIWFGLGALIVSLLVAVFPTIGLTAELAAWLAVSLGLAAFWFKIFKPNIHKTHVGMSDTISSARSGW